ncbi:MAG: transporter [Acidobacteria bacterium]|nr:transporter [Acidobacteriota bacterium]
MKRTITTVLALVGVLTLGALEARASDNQSDSTTTLKVKLALLEKLGTDALRVDVDTNGGDVHLGGTVRERETAELASTITRSVAGVQSVDNDLEVRGTPDTVGGAVAEGENEVKDAMLESRVQLELIDKLGSDGFRIGAEVASGVVTLKFPADLSAGRRDEARSAARAVDGVAEVIWVEQR